jgi:hypothetical protein
MIRKPSSQQTAFEVVRIEGLAPKDYLLREIEVVSDFFLCP